MFLKESQQLQTASPGFVLASLAEQCEVFDTLSWAEGQLLYGAAQLQPLPRVMLGKGKQAGWSVCLSEQLATGEVARWLRSLCYSRILGIFLAPHKTDYSCLYLQF